MIEIHPITTSTSDTPQEVAASIEALGQEAVQTDANGQPIEVTEQIPDPAAPPAAAPAAQPAAAQTASEQEPDEETPELEEIPADAAPEIRTQIEQRNRKRTGRAARIKEQKREIADLKRKQAELEQRLAAPAHQPATPPAAAVQPPPAAQAEPELKKPVMPKLAEFGYDTEQWSEALAQYEADRDAYDEARLEKIKTEVRQGASTDSQAARDQQQQAEQWHATARQAAEQFPDYQQVLDGAAEVPVSRAMGQIVATDVEYGPYFTYFLASNPDIAQQIFAETNLPAAAEALWQLSSQGKPMTVKQQTELGQAILKTEKAAARWAGLIQAHVDTEIGDEKPNTVAPPAAAPPAAPPPPQPRTTAVSRTPAPAAPLRSGGGGTSAGRDPSKMTTSEYMAFMRTEEGRAWAKQNR